MEDTKKAERIPPGFIIGFSFVFLALVMAGILFYRGQHHRLESGHLPPREPAG